MKTDSGKDKLSRRKLLAALGAVGTVAAAGGVLSYANSNGNGSGNGNANGIRRVAEEVVQESMSRAQIIYLASSGGDDTAAFQDALSSASNNALIILEKGATFTISGNLSPVKGCKIIGNGATIVNNISNRAQLFTIQYSGVEIYDLIIENTIYNVGNSPEESCFIGADIYVGGGSSPIQNIILKNITIVGGIAYSSGIICMGAVENVVIENCVVDGSNFTSCFHMEWDTASVVAPKNFILANCIAKNNNQTDPQHLLGFGFWVSAGSNIQLMNCKVMNGSRGYCFYSGDKGQEAKHMVSMIAENCQAVDTRHECFQVFSSPTAAVKNMIVTLKNCHMSGQDITDPYSAGVRIQQYEGVLNIENCLFENLRRGLYIGESGGNPTNNVNVVQNKFNHIYYQAIFGYRLRNCRIEKNTFENITLEGNSNDGSAVIWILNKCENNSIVRNIFGAGSGLYPSRFYIHLQTGGEGDTPTNNFIADNHFLLPTALGFAIINSWSGDSYKILNIIDGNMPINGEPVVAGAAYFKYDGGRKIAFAAAMPTLGLWNKDDYVKNTNISLVDSETEQYLIKGWIRLTTGEEHTLNTDWVEERIIVKV